MTRSDPLQERCGRLGRIHRSRPRDASGRRGRRGRDRWVRLMCDGSCWSAVWRGVRRRVRSMVHRNVWPCRSRVHRLVCARSEAVLGGYSCCVRRHGGCGRGGQRRGCWRWRCDGRCRQCEREAWKVEPWACRWGPVWMLLVRFVVHSSASYRARAHLDARVSSPDHRNLGDVRHGAAGHTVGRRGPDWGWSRAVAARVRHDRRRPSHALEYVRCGRKEPFT